MAAAVTPPTRPRAAPRHRDPDRPARPHPDLATLAVATEVPCAGSSHDGEDFDGIDLSGVDATDARFLGCVVRNCRADGLQLTGARLVDCRLSAVAAADAPWRGGAWQEVELAECRFGALTLSAATWTRVAVSGGRIDYANLRDADLTDVTFTRCDLRDFDVMGATLTRVRFEDCRMGHLDVTGARMTSVDLSTSELAGISGVGGLRGAIVSDGQLAQLGAAFAEHLGIRVLTV
ncbi:MAG: pentapeptide repeat-containing protein [Janthinobacterium lividum]